MWAKKNFNKKDLLLPTKIKYCGWGLFDGINFAGFRKSQKTLTPYLCQKEQKNELSAKLNSWENYNLGDTVT